MQLRLHAREKINFLSISQVGTVPTWWFSKWGVTFLVVKVLFFNVLKFFLFRAGRQVCETLNVVSAEIPLGPSAEVPGSGSDYRPDQWGDPRLPHQDTTPSAGNGHFYGPLACKYFVKLAYWRLTVFTLFAWRDFLL